MAGEKGKAKAEVGTSVINELAKAAGSGIGTVKKEFNKSVKSFNKWLDNTLTPGSLTAKQRQQAKNLNKRINRDKDPLKAFASSKDKTVQRTRTEAADKAKAAADKKKADLKKRQAAERQKEIDANKRRLAKAAKIGGGATVIGVGGKALFDSGSDGKSKSSSRLGTTSRMKKDKQMLDEISKRAAKKKSPVRKTDLGTMGMGLTKIGETKAPKLQRDKKADEAFKAARKAARGTVTGKGNRNVGVGENKRANVTREQLKDSGLTLNQYLNFIDKNNGKRPPKVARKNMGGMMKSKMASKGGKKGGKMGGKMPAGYKAGGMAKKGYSKGGVAKQGANDRLDESLGMRRGKESTKSQSMKSRRDESRGSRKKSTPQSAGVANRGWGAVMK